VRADYRYEFWPDFYFHGTRPVAQLNAQGFTIGALYHFSGPHPSLRAGWAARHAGIDTGLRGCSRIGGV